MNIANKDMWLKISGIIGLTVFILIHIDFFGDYTYTAAITQFCVNTLVFIVGVKVFPGSKGLRRFLSFFWLIVPPIMTSITIYRVFL